MMDLIRDLIKKCEEITGIGFEGELKINGRLNTTLGRASATISENIKTGEITVRPIGIEISKKLLEVATNSEIVDVVSHEFAHYCCYKTIGKHTHDTIEFKKYCLLLNANSAPSMIIQNKIRNKYDVYCNCCNKHLGGFPSSRKKIIKNNGIGFASMCCSASVNITQNW